MELILSFIAIPEEAAKQQARQKTPTPLLWFINQIGVFLVIWFVREPESKISGSD